MACPVHVHGHGRRRGRGRGHCREPLTGTPVERQTDPHDEDGDDGTTSEDLEDDTPQHGEFRRPDWLVSEAYATPIPGELGK